MPADGRRRRSEPGPSGRSFASADGRSGGRTRAAATTTAEPTAATAATAPTGIPDPNLVHHLVTAFHRVALRDIDPDLIDLGSKDGFFLGFTEPSDLNLVCPFFRNRLL